MAAARIFSVEVRVSKDEEPLERHSTLPDSGKNPYVLHPLAYWATAILCLIAPYLFPDRWWVQLATIPVFLPIALMMFAIGWGRESGETARAG